MYKAGYRFKTLLLDNLMTEFVQGNIEYFREKIIQPLFSEAYSPIKNGFKLASDGLLVCEVHKCGDFAMKGKYFSSPTKKKYKNDTNERTHETLVNEVCY